MNKVAQFHKQNLIDVLFFNNADMSIKIILYCFQYRKLANSKITWLSKFWINFWMWKWNNMVIMNFTNINTVSKKNVSSTQFSEELYDTVSEENIMVWKNSVRVVRYRKDVFL